MTLTHVLNPARVEQIVENVFQPDRLAAHEYFDTQRRKTQLLWKQNCPWPRSASPGPIDV